MKETAANAAYIAHNFPIDDLSNAFWETAEPVRTGTYWSGVKAPEGRHFETRLLWSDTHLYVRFIAEQTEELVVNPTPDLSQNADQLWERDVCEIFISPCDPYHPTQYFEFEVAPTGEWLDLDIEIFGGARNTGWAYESGMETAAEIGEGKVTMAFRVSFKALGKTPNPGDVWRGNFFRCVGKGETRGYLAWQPTRTQTPSFHVPEVFGDIRFC